MQDKLYFLFCYFGEHKIWLKGLNSRIYRVGGLN